MPRRSKPLHQRQAGVVQRLKRSEVFFDLLQDAGDADLQKLVEVAGGDGEKLDALEQRVGGVVGLFEDAAVELKPRLVAVQIAALDGWRRAAGTRFFRAAGRRRIAVAPAAIPCFKGSSSDASDDKRK